MLDLASAKLLSARKRSKAELSTVSITDKDLGRMTEGQLIRWLMLTWEMENANQSAYKYFPSILDCSLQFLNNCTTDRAHLGTDRWIVLSSFLKTELFWQWMTLRKSR